MGLVTTHSSMTITQIQYPIRIVNRDDIHDVDISETKLLDCVSHRVSLDSPCHLQCLLRWELVKPYTALSFTTISKIWNNFLRLGPFCNVMNAGLCIGTVFTCGCDWRSRQSVHTQPRSRARDLWPAYILRAAYCHTLLIWFNSSLSIYKWSHPL